MNFQIDSRIVGSHVTHVFSLGAWIELKKARVIAVCQESNNLVLYLFLEDGSVLKKDLASVKFLLTN